MEKKYYYDCPIQALYMMKEFGVEFFIKDDNGDDYDFTEWCLNSQNVLELFAELEAFPRLIYVASESEHIFEPKKGDLGIERNLHTIETCFIETCFFGGIYWLHEDDYLGIIPDPQEVNIIYRNGKHFFNPKEEN